MADNGFDEIIVFEEHLMNSPFSIYRCFTRNVPKFMALLQKLWIRSLMDSKWVRKVVIRESFSSLPGQ